MATWRKHFKPVESNGSNNMGLYSPLGGKGGGMNPGPATRNYNSYLPDIYTGNPNRIERYGQYNVMDMDSEVNAALDILAEFCTQTNKQNNTNFIIHTRETATSSEMAILSRYLQKWYTTQEFETRMFRIMRSTFKYGDQFFIRDPETHKLYYVDPANVTKIIVNESEGKKPEQYVIRNMNLNFKNLVATTPRQTNGDSLGGGSGYLTGGVRGMVGSVDQPGGGTRFNHELDEIAVDAKHIVHLSMSEGLDGNFPFGNSLLETVFKVYKQKELLEDAIIIYRVQRAPERRVFYIDVGNMPSHLASQFVERVKTEIHQRRIPSSTGGGNNVIDSSYNPLSINEDYFFPQTAEGRGSKVDTLPGGTNLGEIDDLRYFTNKLVRGLRIPSSYLPTGADDSSSQYNDGRVGTAYIQELRFNAYCERLQNNLVKEFDKEFKRYLLESGVNIDTYMFELKFQPPQNFAAYRQSEIDNVRIPTFTQLNDISYVSSRFALKRFLGLTDEEIAENERLWKEENDEIVDDGSGDSSSELRSAGISASGMESDLGSLEGGDLGDIGEPEGGEEAAPDAGAEGVAPTETPGGEAGNLPT